MDLTIVAVLVLVFVATALWSGWSGSKKKVTAAANKWQPILDRFKTIGEVVAALREAGLESSQLVVGVDFTQSNEWQGKHSFSGKCLHSLQEGCDNPYQAVLRVIGETLQDFDEDGSIPCFGFGDTHTRDQSVFTLKPSGEDCQGLEEVLACYKQVAPRVELSGPTSFAPLIRKAIDLVKETREYHILLIIADGQVSREADTVRAIVEATKYPLSIVMVGVGDGPWGMMSDFDDKLPEREFDNFQFVDFTQTNKKHPNNPAAFALSALMEIPEQYKAIRSLGLL
eukprot:TRINITY_DN19448_c0_g1_i4.p1 TRINITY_DN19448_c0_g1~~TRINITY_DN19448_c0_g1_i4.p1  ORF type:complete len:284 (-),score=44.52 TRINITY_DN19448_c0_g1_i4:254-1105(-)